MRRRLFRGRRRGRAATVTENVVVRVLAAVWVVRVILRNARLVGR